MALVLFGSQIDKLPQHKHLARSTSFIITVCNANIFKRLLSYRSNNSQPDLRAAKKNGSLIKTRKLEEKLGRSLMAPCIVCLEQRMPAMCLPTGYLRVRNANRSQFILVSNWRWRPGGRRRSVSNSGFPETDRAPSASDDTVAFVVRATFNWALFIVLLGHREMRRTAGHDGEPTGRKLIDAVWAYSASASQFDQRE
jgi:hypothetical protein